MEQALPFLERFLGSFPDVQALSNASEDEVLRAWEGLGYYRRARSLHQAARIICTEHGGRVPRSYNDLIELPGLGPYTAGAVASIAAGEPVPAIDGNAARVLARLFLIEAEVSTASGLKIFHDEAARLLDPKDPGASNQALMELGATLCRPKAPRCDDCPLSSACRAKMQGRILDFPLKRKRGPTPEVDVAFAIVEREGRLLAVRRLEGGLLAGLWGLPGGEVRDSEPAAGAVSRHLRQVGLKLERANEVERRRKEFSSRVWRARVFRCTVSGVGRQSSRIRWLLPHEREHMPFVPFHREIMDGLVHAAPAGGGSSVQKKAS
jgi:A/G-specific adenine glycosylase